MPASLTEQLRDAAALADEIQKLEAQAAQKREQLASLVGHELAFGQSASPMAMPSPDGSPDLTRRIRAFFRTNKGRDFRGDDVARAIGIADVNLVRSLMHRIAKQDSKLGKGEAKVHAVRRGIYNYS